MAMTPHSTIEEVVASLIKLGDEFFQAVEDHNSGRVGRKTPLDDDTEPSFENFIRWLRFRKSNLL